MSYDRLHLDAKTAIASVSINTWNALMRADPDFGRYALSDAGQLAFLAAFTIVANGEWSVGGQLHRIGGPALVFANGDEWWYERGQSHRIGGPACTSAGRAEPWWEHGKRHRIGGPALTFDSGGEVWYEHGREHRIGGPSCTRPDGSMEWCERGEWHRVDGPARIHSNGAMEWWERGVLIHTGDEDRPVAAPVGGVKSRYRRRGYKKHTIASAPTA